MIHARLNSERPIVRVPAGLLSRIVDVSSSATADSTRHIRAEIHAAQAALAVLLQALQRFAAENGTGLQCARPPAVDICAETSILSRGGADLQVVGLRLAQLTAVIGEISGETSTARNGMAEEVVAVDPGVVGAAVEELQRCSEYVVQSRKFAEAGIAVIVP